MNSFVLVIGIFALFYFGYTFYAERIQRLFKPNPERPTPAYIEGDGIDFVPGFYW